MAENQLNRQLAAGIRAAQQGNRERARELLEGVLRQDRNNEQAWIWMASVVESQRERRLSLERVLKINPNNGPAQTALNSMVGVLGDNEAQQINFLEISAAARTPPPTATSRSSQVPGANAPTSNSSNFLPYLVGAGMILGLLLLGSIFIPPLLQPEPTETPTIAPTEDLGPTVDPSIPTSTPTIRPSATFDPSLPTAEFTRAFESLPTFTPTATLPPTETPLPTATLPPLTDYSYIILGVQGSASPNVYTVNGDGTGLSNVLSNVDDFDYNSQTGLLVFTRRTFVEQATLVPTATYTPVPVTNTPSPIGNNNNNDSGGATGFVVNLSGELPDLLQFELFAADIDSTNTSTELTSSTVPSAFEPAISPDGNYVAFASDADGDSEIFVYDFSTSIATQITNNIGISDTQPSWSPDGTQLVFSSERSSVGNNDLYIIDPFADNPESTVFQVTDSRGRNVVPQWSPDGNQLLYLNINGDSTTVRIASIDGSFARDLTFTPSWLFTAPAWTPDGNYVLFSSAPSAQSAYELHILQPITGEDRIVRVTNINVLKVIPR